MPMLVRGLFIVALMSLVTALPPPAAAQLSPRGILGAVMSPFRHFLGRFGHFPHVPRYAAPPERAVANAPRFADSHTVAATRLSQLGPPAWPTGYVDVIGYVFWPNDYAEEVKDRGFDVIAMTITGPFKAPAVGQCDAVATGEDSWPEAQVEQTAHLSNTQKQALLNVQAALNDSTKSLKIDCRDPNATAPTGRFDALIQALWAVRDTGLSVRESLRAFDDTLTGPELAAFSADHPQSAAQTTGNAGSEPNKQMQACAAQNVGEAERMIKQIEQRVHPTKEQSASLESLHKVSADMAKMLAGSCAQPVPADPLARLDATDEQLTTMNYAATAVQISFDDLYGKLDDQQRARLNSAGR
jgi:LTXXQ motif family protein